MANADRAVYRIIHMPQRPKSGINFRWIDGKLWDSLLRGERIETKCRQSEWM